MAKPNFPLNLNRRRLMISVAVLPAASIVPGMQCAIGGALGVGVNFSSRQTSTT